MKRAAAALLVLASVGAAAHEGFLLRDDLLCDGSGRVCIRGWLIHDSQRNQIELDARLEHETAAGTLTIALDGVTPGGQSVTTSLSVEIRGSYSEIIHAKIIPQWPYETRWGVRMLHFEPAEPGEPS